MIGDEVLLYLRIPSLVPGPCETVCHLGQVRINQRLEMFQLRWCISHHGSGLRAWQVEKAISKQKETIS